jgi:hypothetical protein
MKMGSREESASSLQFERGGKRRRQKKGQQNTVVVVVVPGREVASSGTSAKPSRPP